MINILLKIKRVINYVKFYIGLIIKKDNRYVYTQFKKINKNQLKKTNEKEKLLLKNINEILSYSNKHVEYYHNIFKNLGLVNSINDKVQLTSIKDLEGIPILTKEKLNDNFDNLTSNDIGNLKAYLNSSGGSTGKKAMFYQDKNFKLMQRAISYYYRSLFGIKPWHKNKLLLWGSQEDIGTPTIPQNLFLHYMNNESLLLSSSFLTKNQIKSIVEKLKNIKFDYVLGYSQSLDILSDYINSNSIKIKKQNIVFSTATVLSPRMQTNIKKAFRCNVVDFYGSREVGSISYANPFNNNQTIFSDFNYMEIYCSNNSNTGKILITTLHNKSMPLIRYEIGDLGAHLDKRSIFEFKYVKGRQTDIFKKRDGSIIDGTFLTTILNKIRNIKQFQIIQHTYRKIEFKLVSDGKISALEKKQIDEKMIKMFGDNCEIVWTYVNELEASSSGKYLYIISKING